MRRVPVPQAQVSPLPRSQTRILRVFSSSCWINSGVDPFREGGVVLKERADFWEVQLHRVEVDEDDRVGVAHRDAGDLVFLPVHGKRDREGPLSRKSAGISFGVRTGAPMSTVAATALPFSIFIRRVLMPLRVSMVIVSFRAMPLS